MKYDIVLCGVGGQGGISISVVIAQAAADAGLRVKQSEVHGMAQRGGEVLAFLRLSDGPIASPIIPEASADLVLAFEPLEALRYLPYLKSEGRIVSASSPVLNIPTYPPIERVLEALRSQPLCLVVDADGIARESGNAKSANVVLVGAASRFFPFPAGLVEKAIERSFARKGEAVVAANLRAFKHGLAIDR